MTLKLQPREKHSWAYIQDRINIQNVNPQGYSIHSLEYQEQRNKIRDTHKDGI